MYHLLTVRIIKKLLHPPERLEFIGFVVELRPKQNLLPKQMPIWNFICKWGSYEQFPQWTADYTDSYVFVCGRGCLCTIIRVQCQPVNTDCVYPFNFDLYRVSGEWKSTDASKETYLWLICSVYSKKWQMFFIPFSTFQWIDQGIIPSS